MRRARRRPCRVCGLPEKHHLASLCVVPCDHPYEPVEPTPHGVHVAPRVDLKIPDPDGHAEAWREAARREGITLGQLCKRLLDAHIKA